jgi:hypothetical protein
VPQGSRQEDANPNSCTDRDGHQQPQTAEHPATRNS